MPESKKAKRIFKQKAYRGSRESGTLPVKKTCRIYQHFKCWKYSIIIIHLGIAERGVSEVARCGDAN